MTKYDQTLTIAYLQTPALTSETTAATKHGATLTLLGFTTCVDSVITCHGKTLCVRALEHSGADTEAGLVMSLASVGAFPALTGSLTAAFSGRVQQASTP
jgi:hypothetical protein